MFSITLKSQNGKYHELKELGHYYFEALCAILWGRACEAAACARTTHLHLVFGCGMPAESMGEHQSGSVGSLGSWDRGAVRMCCLPAKLSNCCSFWFSLIFCSSFCQPTNWKYVLCLYSLSAITRLRTTNSVRRWSSPSTRIVVCLETFLISSIMGTRFHRKSFWIPRRLNFEPALTA